MTDVDVAGWVAFGVIVIVIVIALVIVTLAALFLRKEPWRRIRLGIFIDRNGDGPHDPR